MWKDIENAKHHVYLESYIIQNDNVGYKFLRLLGEAKQRGCEVKICYDQMGSARMHFSNHFESLRKLGCSIYPYHQLYGRWRPFMKWRSPLHRNHRKILIADDVGYTGGLNIGMDYADTPIGNKTGGEPKKLKWIVYDKSGTQLANATLSLLWNEAPKTCQAIIDSIQTNNEVT
eukprot:UN05769